MRLQEIAEKKDFAQKDSRDTEDTGDSSYTKQKQSSQADVIMGGGPQ